MTWIHPTAEVESGAVLGSGVEVWNWSKVRVAASVGAGTRLGQCVYVDAGVSIGSGCKIQNGVSIFRGVTIRDRVFVGPSVAFVNDRHPRAFSTDWEVIPTEIEEGASIGANATILCGITLGRYCLVGAGAVVTKDVPPFALVAGQPARIIGAVDIAGHVERSDRRPGDERR